MCHSLHRRKRNTRILTRRRWHVFSLFSYRGTFWSGPLCFFLFEWKGNRFGDEQSFFFFLIFNSFITSTTYWKISYMFSDIAPPFVFNQTSWKFSHCSMWFIFYYVCKKCYFRKMFWVLLLFLDFLCLFFL